MRITFDSDADSAYIYFKKISAGEVMKTISLNDSINVDLDNKGKTLGIEIINASKNLPKNTLKTCEVIS
ncbi:MAG: DUF2283 domain-containing protein [Nanoarchaeota archaeon]